jgi:hypothetical protein
VGSPAVITTCNDGSIPFLAQGILMMQKILFLQFIYDTKV